MQYENKEDDPNKKDVDMCNSKTMRMLTNASKIF